MIEEIRYLLIKYEKINNVLLHDAFRYLLVSLWILVLLEL